MKKQFIEVNEDNLIDATNCLMNKTNVVIVRNVLDYLNYDELVRLFTLFEQELYDFIDWFLQNAPLPYIVRVQQNLGTVMGWYYTYNSSIVNSINQNQSLTQDQRNYLLQINDRIKPIPTQVYNSYIDNLQQNSVINNISNKMEKKPKQIKEFPDGFEKSCIAPVAAPSNPNVMPDATVEQIAQCIENATQEVRNYTPNVPNSSIFRKWGITIRNQPFILDAIEYAQNFPDTLPVHLDITEWATNIKRFNIFMLLFRLADILLTTLRRAFRIPAVRTFEQFSNYYANVQMLASQGDNDAQVIYERLKPLFARGRRIGTNNNKEDLEMELDEARKLMDDSNIRIKSIIEKEKSLRRDINKNIHQQDDLLDEKQTI